ncbi:WYL domain-containing protein [Streptomyces uncialis]|uniref:WYL domain-containing protein n=1 Tax=Streptomyces uncialis TaxID=1048205 RepID=UPI0037A6851D
MRHTKNETTAQTLTRLIKALDSSHPVTITYTKADSTITIRTIEIYDINITAAGDITIKAMDRESGESRTFRLDRITAYTTHRTAYTITRSTTDETKARTAHGLATVTVLYPVDLPIADRIDLLADTLAA